VYGKKLVMKTWFITVIWRNGYMVMCEGGKTISSIIMIISRNSSIIIMAENNEAAAS